MARLPRIPDLFTTANLACGMGSILLASQGQLTWACWLVFAGALFDVFDGLAARALGGGSPLGAQLDSLADMVTFGVAPGIILWCSHLSNRWSHYVSTIDASGPVTTLTPLWMYGIASLVLVIATCWRLAKFNLDTRQTSGFLGLPTPSNGLFWVSAVMGSMGVAVHPGPGHKALTNGANTLLGSPYALLALSFLLAALMLSELPLPSLKFKHFRWQGNQVIYLLGGIGALLVVLYGIMAVPLIMLLYLLSPLWGRVFPKV